eukprot:jgi/Ulvmu1/7104/UM034_0010.1
MQASLRVSVKQAQRGGASGSATRHTTCLAGAVEAGAVEAGAVEAGAVRQDPVQRRPQYLAGNTHVNLASYYSVAAVFQSRRREVPLVVFL